MRYNGPSEHLPYPWENTLLSCRWYVSVGLNASPGKDNIKDNFVPQTELDVKTALDAKNGRFQTLVMKLMSQQI